MIREENVPKEWDWKSLGEICEIVGGKPRPKGEEPYKDGTIPFVRMRDLGKYHLTSNLTEIESLLNSQYVHENSIRVIKKGSILIPRSGSVALNHRAVLGVDACIVSHICALELIDPNVNNLYLYYVLRQVDMRKYMKKTTGLDLITFYDLRRINVPLPSINIQKDIVSILEKAEQLKQWRKDADKLANDYLSSVFIEMFGNPIANPMNWKEARTIDVANCIVPGRDKPKSFTGNIPWITTEDLNHLGKTYNSGKDLGLSLDEISEVHAKIIPRNSVLMTCVGDLGLVSIAGRDMVINQQLHSFQCSEAVNNIFLMFNLSFFKPYMYKIATSTTVPYMNKKNCNSIPTILPPIEKQNRFAKIFEQNERVKVIQKQSKQKIDRLFSVLLQKAFRGELVC